MSVTGLVVALGLLVDGSIVMTDEIRKRLMSGLQPIEAMKGAVSRMRIPLMSSTLTTVLAFIPLVLLPGAGGDFLGSIAVAVIAMLVSSFILAIAVTPVLAARWLLSGIALEKRWWRAGADNEKIDFRLPPLAAVGHSKSTGFFRAGLGAARDGLPQLGHADPAVLPGH